MQRHSKMHSSKDGFEGAAYVPPDVPEMRIEEFPDFYLPLVESMSDLSSAFKPPWEDWPAWPPPSTWQYSEPIDALHDAPCAPHQLPPNVEMSYGPPYPWIWPDPPKPQNPNKELPVREYLVIEKIYDLCLEAMKLAVIERPDRPVKFVALYIREKNPLACKVKCRRHIGETCHCKILLTPSPFQEPEPEPDKAEPNEEAK